MTTASPYTFDIVRQMRADLGTLGEYAGNVPGGDEHPTPTVRRMYVASSWRNAHQPSVVAALRDAGFEVYDFRHPEPGNDGFSWSEIDPAWQSWTPEHYREALTHPVAEHGFGRDFGAMQWADTCVLVLPSGRSAHLEGGWMAGTGRRLYVLMLEPQEPELMALMATGGAAGICLSIDELARSARRGRDADSYGGAKGRPDVLPDRPDPPLRVPRPHADHDQDGRRPGGDPAGLPWPCQRTARRGPEGRWRDHRRQGARLSEGPGNGQRGGRVSERRIRVGDVVQWHPEAGFNIEWVITEIHSNGRLTIEVDLVEGESTRRIRKSAHLRDCRLVGEQLGLGLDA